MWCCIASATFSLLNSSRSVVGMRNTSDVSGGNISSSVGIGSPNRSNFGVVVDCLGASSTFISLSMLDFDLDFLLFDFFFGAFFDGAPNPPPAKQTVVRLLIADGGGINAVTQVADTKSRKRLFIMEKLFA